MDCRTGMDKHLNNAARHALYQKKSWGRPSRKGWGKKVATRAARALDKALCRAG